MCSIDFLHSLHILEKLRNRNNNDSHLYGKELSLIFCNKNTRNTIHIRNITIEIPIMYELHLFACTGVGVGMTRDTSTLMVAQYFKRKREFVEIFILSASGVGLALSSVFLNGAIGYSRIM